MNDKFTEDFIKEQLDVMEKFEKADWCLYSEYIAAAKCGNSKLCWELHKILLLVHEIRSWCKDMSAVCDQFDDNKKRAIEAERKVKNLHKIISKQQLKIQRQAENISTLLDLYTGGEQSRAHEELKEKYEYLKKIYRNYMEQK